MRNKANIRENSIWDIGVHKNIWLKSENHLSDNLLLNAG